MEFLKPLAAPERTEFPKVGSISFRHPAYPETERVLLRLSAVDGPERDGVDYDFGLISCGIVTGNTWPDGSLAVKRGDTEFEPVTRPEDGVLREEEYFYFVGTYDASCKVSHINNNLDIPTDIQFQTDKYPVIPSFHHWRFPHRKLPAFWKEFTIAPGPDSSNRRKDEAVLSRDGTCRITAHKAAREVAHLVPVADGPWFNLNDMRRYCNETAALQPIDDLRNAITLRRDLHYLFDARRFALTVKRDKSGRSGLIIHVLDCQSNDELLDLYHNRCLQPICGIAPELIFARLAWTIFNSQAFPLFDGMAKMAVRVFVPNTGKTEDCHLFQQEIRGKQNLFGHRSRSTSPQKRTLQEMEDAAEDAAEGWSFFPEIPEDDGRASDASFEERPERGRRRKRSWDEDAYEEPPELTRSSHSPGHSRSWTDSQRDEVPTPSPSGQLGEELSCGHDNKRPHKRPHLKEEAQSGT